MSLAVFQMALIDYDKLTNVLGIESYDLLRASHRGWVEESLGTGNNDREGKWTQSIAVGSEEFIEKTWAELGIKAKGRKVREAQGAYVLREPEALYGDDFEVKNGGLRLENTYLWDVFPDISI